MKRKHTLENCEIYAMGIKMKPKTNKAQNHPIKLIRLDILGNSIEYVATEIRKGYRTGIK
jgi:hypothetical protein